VPSCQSQTVQPLDIIVEPWTI